MGSDTLGWTRIGTHSVIFRCASEVELHPGDKKVIGFDTARGSIFDASTGNRI